MELKYHSRRIKYHIQNFPEFTRFIYKVFIYLNIYINLLKKLNKYSKALM